MSLSVFRPTVQTPSRTITDTTYANVKSPPIFYARPANLIVSTATVKSRL